MCPGKAPRNEICSLFKIYIREIRRDCCVVGEGEAVSLGFKSQCLGQFYTQALFSVPK